MSDDGKLLAKKIIDKFNLRDSAGTPHKPSGLLSSKADVLVFVCKDDHPDTGRRIHFLSMERVRHCIGIAFKTGEKPASGSRRGIEVSDTGFGYNVHPYHLNGVDIPLTSNNPDTEKVFEEYLSERKWRKASVQEQKEDGIDYIVFDAVDDAILSQFCNGTDPLKIEVKGREPDKRYERIFLQVSETNPTGNHSSAPIRAVG